MRINLTKKDLVNLVYMQIGFSKSISENLIDEFFSIIVSNLKKEKKVTFAVLVIVTSFLVCWVFLWYHCPFFLIFQNIFKRKFKLKKKTNFQKNCNPLPFGSTPDLSNLLKQ